MAAMGMKDMEMEGGPMATSSAPAAYLAEAFVMWLIMMVAMMLPSAAPTILRYGKLAGSGRQQGGVLASTTVFAGYLCLDCLQTRLVRLLTEADFISTPFEILSRFVAGALDDAFEPRKG
jgi:predicted metal-binding membrane protein